MWKVFTLVLFFYDKKGKVIPLLAWRGPEDSRRLGFQISRHEGGKLVSSTHRPRLPSESIPGTHFCQMLSQPQGHSAAGRMPTKNSNDAIGNRTRDLPTCSALA